MCCHKKAGFEQSIYSQRAQLFAHDKNIGAELI